MDAKTLARSYLERHDTYIDALKSLLQDLGEARQVGKADEEERLCAALTALRALNKD